MEGKRYRPNVAAIVVNDQGQILACRRADKFHSWQLPQGGVNKGEDLQTAVLRELKEEIGTDDVDILGQLPEVICYDWPAGIRKGGYTGQEQSYFLLRLRSSAVIDLNSHRYAEFDEVEWLPIAEFLNRLDGFKAEAYTKAIRSACSLYPEVCRETEKE